MQKKEPYKKIAELLPWYLTNRLADDERQKVKNWLHTEQEAGQELSTWQNLYDGVAAQPQITAPDTARRQIMAKIIRQPAPKRQTGWQPRLVWLWGTALAAIVMILLWGVVQPGIKLQWSTNNSDTSTFRVYRATTGQADFNTLGELPAKPDAQNYSYVDTLLWPGQSYVYRVETVSQAGEAATSQIITINGMEALPGQLAVLLTGLIVGWGIINLYPAVSVRTFS